MNKIFLAIEKYLVDPNELESKPGGVIRLKGSEIDDVRKVVAELQISDAPLSAFRETAELERQIQEATGINRVTLGTAGMVRDTNATLGGMQLLQQNAQDRFMFYAFVIAKASMRRAAKMIMSLSYQNRDDESIRRIIGMMPVTIIDPETGQIVTVAKWKAFKKMPPHELEKDYDLVPTDVFTAQNKAERRAAITSFMQLASTVLPGMNPRPGMEKLGKYSDFSSEEVLEILGPDRGQMPTPMGMGMGVPSMARPTSKGPAGLAASPQTEQPPMPSPAANGPMG